MFLIDHPHFSRFSIELKYLFISESVCIEKIDESISTSNQDLCASVHIFYINYVL